MIAPQPKAEWSDLERPGCQRIQFRVLHASDGIAIANLAFDTNATIDPHDAPYDIDVMCMTGRGFVSIDNETWPISAGESIRWPAGKMHCLWTKGSTMETLMLERYGLPTEASNAAAATESTDAIESA